MAEYNTDGYTDVRTYVYNNHNWLAIVDDTDTEQLRWDLNSNANVTEVAGPSTNPIEYEITVTGQDLVDAGATLPVTIERGKLYDSDTSSTPYSDNTLTDDSGNPLSAQLGTVNDEVVATFTNEWPQV